MELIERINAIESEVKLMKSEIKKVLIDLREAMNNFENPFAHIEQGGPALAIGLGGIESPRSESLVGADRAVPEPKPVSVPNPEPMPAVKEAIEPESPPAASVTSKPEENSDKQLKRIMMVTGGEEVAELDILRLTQLMKWTDDTLSLIGNSKLNEILDLYDRTGQLTQDLKDLIYRIEDLSDVNPVKEIEEVEMTDCILAVEQLDKIITGETATPVPLLLSEDEYKKCPKV